MSDPIDSNRIVENLTKVYFENYGSCRFTETIDAFLYRQDLDGTLDAVSLHKESQSQVRMISIRPFKRGINYRGKSCGERIYASIEDGESAQREFDCSISFKITMIKPYSNSIKIKTVEVESFDDMISLLKLWVEELLKDGFLYSFRTKPTTKITGMEGTFVCRESIKMAIDEVNLIYDSYTLSLKKLFFPK